MTGKKGDRVHFFLLPYDLFSARHRIQYIVYVCTHARTCAIYRCRSNNIDCARPSLESAGVSKFSFPFFYTPTQSFLAERTWRSSAGPINRPNRFLTAGFPSVRWNERRDIITIFYGYVTFVGSYNVSLTCR